MNERDWSWITGFFEGEGSCGLYLSQRRKGPSYRLEASISQKERQVLDHIQSILGIGYVSLNKTNYGEMYQWRVGSSGARAFLHAIQPYLRSNKKIEQVRRALQEDSEKVRPRNTRKTEPPKWQISTWQLNLSLSTKEDSSTTPKTLEVSRTLELASVPIHSSEKTESVN